MKVTYFNSANPFLGYYTEYESITKSILHWHKNPIVIVPHGELAYQLAGDKTLLNQVFRLYIIKSGEYISVPAGEFAYLIHDSTYEPKNNGRLVTLTSKII